MYPAGLLLLVLAQWFIALFNWREALLPIAWWAPVLVLLLALVLGIMAYRLRSRFTFESIRDQWLVVSARRAGALLAAFLRMDWLYQLLAWIYTGVQAVVQLLTSIIEGDGGVIWAIVMLAMLISLLNRAGVTP